MRSPRIDALVLAAGRSLRAGGPNKLLLPWQDKAVVAHAVDAALARATAELKASGSDAAFERQVGLIREQQKLEARLANLILADE